MNRVPLSDSNNGPDLGDNTRAATLLVENALLVAQANGVQLKQERKKLLRENADAVIKKNVIYSMALGLIPVPAFDILALTHAQFKMTDELLKVYNMPHDKIGQSVLRSFIIGVLPVATLASAGSLFKAVPGIGSLVGSSSVSVGSGTLTFTIGKILVQHFEKGGKLSDFNLIEAKKRFKKDFSGNKKSALALIKTSGVSAQEQIGS